MISVGRDMVVRQKIGDGPRDCLVWPSVQLQQDCWSDSLNGIVLREYIETNSMLHDPETETVIFQGCPNAFTDDNPNAYRMWTNSSMMEELWNCSEYGVISMNLKNSQIAHLNQNETRLLKIRQATVKNALMS